MFAVSNFNIKKPAFLTETLPQLKDQLRSTFSQPILASLHSIKRKTQQFQDEQQSIFLQVGSKVWEGVPRNMRAELWLSVLQRKDAALGSDAAAKYEDMLGMELKPKTATDIDKDVPRTFPNTKKFSSQEGQNALRRVLRAYAAYDPEVGYCQGMNFLAGLLLLYLSEEHAFGALVLIMFERGFRLLYQCNMSLLQAQLWQLGQLMPSKLRAHMESCGVVPVLFAAPWLMTCYSADFPISFSSRVLDTVFSNNMVSPLLRVAVVLLKCCEKKLRTLPDMEDILMFLKLEVPAWEEMELHAILTEAFNKDWPERHKAVLDNTDGMETIAQAMARVHATPDDRAEEVQVIGTMVSASATTDSESVMAEAGAGSHLPMLHVRVASGVPTFSHQGSANGRALMDMEPDGDAATPGSAASSCFSFSDIDCMSQSGRSHEQDEASPSAAHSPHSDFWDPYLHDLRLFTMGEIIELRNLSFNKTPRNTDHNGPGFGKGLVRSRSATAHCSLDGLAASSEDDDDDAAFFEVTSRSGSISSMRSFHHNRSQSVMVEVGFPMSPSSTSSPRARFNRTRTGDRSNLRSASTSQPDDLLGMDSERRPGLECLHGSLLGEDDVFKGCSPRSVDSAPAAQFGAGPSLLSKPSFSCMSENEVMHSRAFPSAASLAMCMAAGSAVAEAIALSRAANASICSSAPDSETSMYTGRETSMMSTQSHASSQALAEFNDVLNAGLTALKSDRSAAPENQLHFPVHCPHSPGSGVDTVSALTSSLSSALSASPSPGTVSPAATSRHGSLHVALSRSVSGTPDQATIHTSAAALEHLGSMPSRLSHLHVWTESSSSDLIGTPPGTADAAVMDSARLASLTDTHTTTTMSCFDSLHSSSCAAVQHMEDVPFSAENGAPVADEAPRVNLVVESEREPMQAALRAAHGSHLFPEVSRAICIPAAGALPSCSPSTGSQASNIASSQLDGKIVDLDGWLQHFPSSSGAVMDPSNAPDGPPHVDPSNVLDGPAHVDPSNVLDGPAHVDPSNVLDGPAHVDPSIVLDGLPHVDPSNVLDGLAHVDASNVLDGPAHVESQPLTLQLPAESTLSFSNDPTNVYNPSAVMNLTAAADDAVAMLPSSAPPIPAPAPVPQPSAEPPKPSIPVTDFSDIDVGLPPPSLQIPMRAMNAMGSASSGASTPTAPASRLGTNSVNGTPPFEKAAIDAGVALTAQQLPGSSSQVQCSPRTSNGNSALAEYTTAQTPVTPRSSVSALTESVTAPTAITPRTSVSALTESVTAPTAITPRTSVSALTESVTAPTAITPRTSISALTESVTAPTAITPRTSVSALTESVTAPTAITPRTSISALTESVAAHLSSTPPYTFSSSPAPPPMTPSRLSQSQIPQPASPLQSCSSNGAYTLADSNPCEASFTPMASTAASFSSQLPQSPVPATHISLTAINLPTCSSPAAVPSSISGSDPWPCSPPASAILHASFTHRDSYAPSHPEVTPCHSAALSKTTSRLGTPTLPNSPSYRLSSSGVWDATALQSQTSIGLGPNEEELDGFARLASARLSNLSARAPSGLELPVYPRSTSQNNRTQDHSMLGSPMMPCSPRHSNSCIPDILSITTVTQASCSAASPQNPVINGTHSPTTQLPRSVSTSKPTLQHDATPSTSPGPISSSLLRQNSPQLSTQATRQNSRRASVEFKPSASPLGSVDSASSAAFQSLVTAALLCTADAPAQPSPRTSGTATGSTPAPSLPSAASPTPLTVPSIPSTVPVAAPIHAPPPDTSATQACGPPGVSLWDSTKPIPHTVLTSTTSLEHLNTDPCHSTGAQVTSHALQGSIHSTISSKQDSTPSSATKSIATPFMSEHKATDDNNSPITRNTPADINHELAFTNPADPPPYCTTPDVFEDALHGPLSDTTLSPEASPSHSPPHIPPAQDNPPSARHPNKKPWNHVLHVSVSTSPVQDTIFSMSPGHVTDSPDPAASNSMELLDSLPSVPYIQSGDRIPEATPPPQGLWYSAAPPMIPDTPGSPNIASSFQSVDSFILVSPPAYASFQRSMNGRPPSPGRDRLVTRGAAMFAALHGSHRPKKSLDSQILDQLNGFQANCVPPSAPAADSSASSSFNQGPVAGQWRLEQSNSFSRGEKVDALNERLSAYLSDVTTEVL